MIDATFCAGAGMIAFGVVLGKTTPTQLTWLMVGMVSSEQGLLAVVGADRDSGITRGHATADVAALPCDQYLTQQAC